MSKYLGPRLRIVRRIGELCAFTRKTPNRRTRPGEQGKNRSKIPQIISNATILSLNYKWLNLKKRFSLVVFSKKCAKSLSLSSQPKLKKLRIVIWHIIFRKRLSKIKPPLNYLLS